MKASKLTKVKTVPTGEWHHTSKVRDGKQSAEVFAKKPERRMELGLPVFTSDSYA